MKPVVVQGSVVSPKKEQLIQPLDVESAAPGGSSSYSPTNNYNLTNISEVKGEKQVNQFQDVCFGITFWFHIVGVCSYMLLQYPKQLGNYANTGLILVVGICFGFAVLLSSFMLSFMMRFAKQIIQISLVFSVIISAVVAILAFLSGVIVLSVFCALSFFVGICYTYFVWSRIPFAAANLNTGLTAVKTNLGVAFVGYLFLIVACVWTFGWISVYTTALNGNAGEVDQFSVFLFLLSYFWTHQVITNIVHVTVAGVVGTWWHNPSEAQTCCSPAIRDSFIRSTTFSFGSICFGSLLVALVQTLRQMNHMARDQEECNILVCLIDCVLGCIEGIIEYLNKWAYIYVGLYGYSYLDAGKNVMALFQHRGWSVIITDDLVDKTLLLVSVTIALLTGIWGALAAQIQPDLFAAFGEYDSSGTGFVIGLIVGFVSGSIMMSVVGSAVDTVIVCFTEAPMELQNNYPVLGEELRDAWKRAWPSETQFI